MKKLMILAVLFTILTFLSPPSAQSSEIMLYVRNKEFNNEVVMVKGVLYAPIEPFLKAMKCGWVQTGNNVLINVLEGKGTDLIPLTGENLTFSYLGNSFTAPLLMKSGVLFVSIPAMAKGLQAKFELNKETGIADVIRLRSVGEYDGIWKGLLSNGTIYKIAFTIAENKLIEFSYNLKVNYANLNYDDNIQYICGENAPLIENKQVAIDGDIKIIFLDLHNASGTVFPHVPTFNSLTFTATREGFSKPVKRK